MFDKVDSADICRASDESVPKQAGQQSVMAVVQSVSHPSVSASVTPIVSINGNVPLAPKHIHDPEVVEIQKGMLVSIKSDGWAVIHDDNGSRVVGLAESDQSDVQSFAPTKTQSESKISEEEAEPVSPISTAMSLPATKTAKPVSQSNQIAPKLNKKGHLYDDDEDDSCDDMYSPPKPNAKRAKKSQKRISNLSGPHKTGDKSPPEAHDQQNTKTESTKSSPELANSASDLTLDEIKDPKQEKETGGKPADNPHSPSEIPLKEDKQEGTDGDNSNLLSWQEYVKRMEDSGEQISKQKSGKPSRFKNNILTRQKKKARQESDKNLPDEKKSDRDQPRGFPWSSPSPFEKLQQYPQEQSDTSEKKGKEHKSQPSPDSDSPLNSDENQSNAKNLLAQQERAPISRDINSKSSRKQALPKQSAQEETKTAGNLLERQHYGGIAYCTDDRWAENSLQAAQVHLMKKGETILTLHICVDVLPICFIASSTHLHG